MSNFVSLMKIDAKRATPEDFEKAKATLAQLLPTLKTKADHQKAFTALEAKVMSTRQPESAAAALVALKVAEAGGLESR